MSEEHVTAVFGPPWVREALADSRTRVHQGERVVLALRRLLITHDPSLPNEYDGNAWAAIEQTAAPNQPATSDPPA